MSRIKKEIEIQRLIATRRRGAEVVPDEQPIGEINERSKRLFEIAEIDTSKIRDRGEYRSAVRAASVIVGRQEKAAALAASQQYLDENPTLLGRIATNRYGEKVEVVDILHNEGKVAVKKIQPPRNWYKMDPRNLRFDDGL